MRLSITLIPELKLVAQECARKQHRSLSNLFMHALCGYLTRYKYKVPQEVKDTLRVQE